VSVVVVVGAEDASVVQAFREETILIVVAAPDCDVDKVAAELAGADIRAVVAASAVAVPAVRALQRALGLSDGLSGLPLEQDAQRVAAQDDEPTRGVHYSVALVSRDGAHVSAGVYEDQFVGGCRKSLRSRISVPSRSETASIVEATARAYLDDFAIRDGATCVAVELVGESPRPVGVAPGVMAPAPPADAAFHAYGHSHEHLLAESVLRPREFERRLVRPLQPGQTTLAIIALRAPRDGVLRGAAGLRTIRRLTGFYAVSKVLPGTAFDPGEIVAIATFVHSDRASVANSLTAIAEIEEAGGIFVEDYQLIGLAPTAS
jgi:hypothetical protein